MPKDNILMTDLGSIETILGQLSQEFNREALWWRGHSDADWQLVPGAFRPNNFGVSGHTLISHFKTRAVSMLGHKRRPLNDLEWLLLAQHYGLPTQLLDWTENLPVALYFAVTNPTQADIDGCIWVLSPSLMNKHHADPYSPGHGSRGLVDVESRPVCSLAMKAAGVKDDAIWRNEFPDFKEMPLFPKVVAFLAPETDERIVAQSGRFTLHGTAVDLVTLKGSEAYLRKFIIPSSEKSKISALLQALGIRRWNLFPDLTSLAEGLKAGNFG